MIRLEILGFSGKPDPNILLIHQKTALITPLVVLNLIEKERNFNREFYFQIKAISFLCKLILITVNAFVDGLLVLPFLVSILAVFLSEIISISNKTRFQVWLVQVKLLRFFNFGGLFFILVCNSHYIQSKLSSRAKLYLGDIRIQTSFDMARVGFLFLLQAMLSYHDDQMASYITKYGFPSNEELSMEKFVRRGSQHSQESWYIKLFSVILRMITVYSYKIIQIMLILWGLSRVSLVLFCFVTMGIIGVQVTDVFFAKYMLRTLLVVGFVFVSIQTGYNLSTEQDFFGL